MPEPPPIWSDAFLAEEIREQPEYKALEEGSAEFDAFVETARKRLGEIRSRSRRAKERPTIDRAITPLLEALGWPTPVPEVRLTARDQVDLVLHATAEQGEALRDAANEHEQVLNAAGIVECKAWGNPFDTSGSGSESESRRGETAAQQIQRYLLIAGTDSNESLRWGILTNGARWRIYSYRARPRDRTWEIDLERLLVSQDLFTRALNDETIHQLRLAWLLLRRDSWVPAPGERESFLDRILEAGRRRDAKVADSLSEAIFNNVYPRLVELFWGKRSEAPAEPVARAALTFLYRLLFIYYAEDRGMLDTENPGYRPHSLRYSVRDPIAEQLGASQFSTVSTQFWQRLKTLRAIIDRGDNSIGQPAYNGGLFSGYDPILDEIELSDAELAPIIHELSHTADGTYISYRSLEVRQLGSIYERLLERVPQRDADGNVEVVISPYARKDSGSYYTPQELVDLIVEQTLTPLVEERIATFRGEPDEANDPAAALLNLKILDPAMGSGHFLITALDWLTGQLAALVNREWPEAEPGYISPIRAQLWELQEEHPDLNDETLLRRMALKRCLYGVDKNPLAVELAKVAIWLHTFTPPLPLPYINHRVRAGDSLLGIDYDRAADYIAEWGPDHMSAGLRDDRAGLLGHTATPEQQLSGALDLLIAAVRKSERVHDGIETYLSSDRRALDLVTAFHWLSIGMTKKARKEFHAPLTDALSGHVGRAVSILYNGENKPGLTQSTPEFQQIRDRGREIADRENFFHWQVEFPHVMDQGGFDAIITNPPWDRIKLQEVEWWGARREGIAKAPTAAARKQMIAELRGAGEPLVAEYDEAVERAAQLSATLRGSGDYPQLGRGDINLYSLFVERALSLINPNGVAGLLTPSGIYSDKTAAEFFRGVSTTGRIGGIYDFENRGRIPSDPKVKAALWFADVDSRFKFCATIFAGSERRFDETQCGFYLNGKADLQNADRVFPLAPDDFARINPNTGTAPTLRSPTDARLIRRIYRDHPVLVDRSSGETQRPYAVRQLAMFHMTNDSHFFRTAEQLKEEGCYPVVGHRYRRGDAEWAPLYQGRMIHHFDHRANAVGFNPENQDNPYLSVEVTDEQKQDSKFFPAVQYWVSTAEIESRLSADQSWVIGFRDIARSADERTVIATIVPWAAFSNKVPLLLPDPTLTASDAALLAANLSSLTLDFVAKRKVQGTNLNWFIIEQLPVIAPADYGRKFGETTAGELVRDHVLRLSYTAHDLAPFARDLGYAADPFPWDPEERRRLRACLDALYFHLYGLGEDDTAYILDQFPVLEKNERREHGRYVTKELVLGYYNALAAGDATSTITLPPLSE